MNDHYLLKSKALFTLFSFFLTALFVFFEHLNGGIITHHLLADEKMPGFSNLWGLITIPVTTWITFTFLTKARLKKEGLKQNENSIIRNFLIGLIFGIGASLLWAFNLENILQYYILTPFLISLFKPIYSLDFYLGFVLGMLHTFGGIIPLIVGFVILIICFVLHFIIQKTLRPHFEAR